MSAVPPNMSIHSRPGFIGRHGFWLLPIVLGLLAGGMVYGLLPQAGVATFANHLSFKKIIALSFLAVAGVSYIYYFRYVTEKPQWLIYFILMGWALVNYGNDFLLQSGVNIHLRPMIIMALGLPGLWVALCHGKTVLAQVPHFRYYLVFFIWLMLYFFFYNAHAQDPTLISVGSHFEGSVGVIQATAYFYCTMAIAVAAAAVIRHPNAGQYFDGLNKALLIVSSLIAIYTIIGYPTLLTSVWLDGFQRANGIYTHPNPFAHHMGLLLVYLLGMFLYYQDENKSRMPGWLMIGGFVINMGAFLLGMSKTAIGVFVLSAVVLLLLNLSSPIVRKHIVKVVVSLVVLVPIGLWLYGAIADESFFSIFQRRMDVKDSFVWRLESWDFLVSGFHGWWLVLGHGFTAANAWMFQLTYDTENNIKPLMMVHNGYIALLYDLGLMGLVFFVAVLSNAWRSFCEIFRPGRIAVRPLLATVVALSVYFLITCGFDEMTYMFDAPLTFWILTTTLFCIAFKRGGGEPDNGVSA